MKSYNLYFFRHGITKGNLNAQYIGHTDLPLTTDSINTIITIDDFIEYNFGEFEQCTADDLKDNEDFKNWIGGDIYAKTPYGESNAEFAQRICAAFEKVIDGCIKTGTQNIAIVGHAGVLMTLLSCYGLPEAPMAHWQMDPGYGFRLRITPSLWMRANKIEVIDTSPQSMNKE